MKRTLHTSLGKDFTLVELLVVIAIMAILTGILLPSISKARDRVKSLACLSNLKQMGYSATMYSNDYNGYIVKVSTGVSYSGWFYKLWPYFMPGSNVPPATIIAMIPWKGTLLHCPSNHFDSNPNGTDFDYQPFSYSMSDYLHGLPQDYTVQRKSSAITFPAEVNFISDSPRGCYISGRGYLACLLSDNALVSSGSSAVLSLISGSAYQHQREMRHNGGTTLNVLFLDGHAEARAPQGLFLLSYYNHFWLGN